MLPSMPGVSRLPVHAGFGGERLPHVARASKVCIAFRQRAPFRLSEMRRLRKDQELVEGIYTETGHQFQTNSQPNAAEIVHRLVEREAACVAKGPVSSPELILDNIPRIAEQDPPRLFLSLDDVANDTHQVIQQFILRPSERRLVGDLKEVADNLAAFAVQPTVRQPHLLQSRQDLPDLLRQHESRQMDQ